MKHTPFLLFFIFLVSCQQNKELKTPLIEKASNLEKTVEIEEPASNVDFLSSEKKLWYEFNEGLPVANYSRDNKNSYEVYFFAKIEKDYTSISSKLEDASDEQIKTVVKNKKKFYKIAFLTKSGDIGKAVENGETNYYAKYPSFKYIYLYDDDAKTWKYVDKVLYQNFDDKKIGKIQEIIQKEIHQRLSSKATNKSLENWLGSYYWDYDEGKNAANESTQSSYTINIQSNSVSYEGMGYQVDFKYSCLYENKGDTLNIYQYKNLETNKSDLNVFPLQISKKDKKYFIDFLDVKEKEVIRKN